MLSKKRLREIKEHEKNGMSVVVISNEGKLEYATRLGESGCCDQCDAFRLLPDLAPDDWFRDGDMKAVCLEVNGVIEGNLEKSSEWTNICKPLYCPKLGRKLTEKEKQEAAEMLKWAKARMKRS